MFTLQEVTFFFFFKGETKLQIHFSQFSHPYGVKNV